VSCARIGNLNTFGGVSERPEVIGAGASAGHRGVRRWTGLCIHAALLVALLAGYVLLAPPSRWDDPLTLAVLVALGVIAIQTEVRLPAGISFEALSALALIATALAGALPALVVTLTPIVVSALSRRERLLRAGNLANLVAYGGYTLAGAVILNAVAANPTAPAAFGWLLVVGLIQLLLNWALGPVVYVTFWLGHSPRTVLDILRDGLPTGAVMVLLGACTVVLTPALGVLALAMFAAIALLPQSFLTYAARTRPVARLDRDTATRRYAHALALHVGLSRAERRHVADVATAVNRRPPTGEPVDYVRATLRDCDRATRDAQLLPEWWNGSGGPIGLTGDAIPIAARVLSVASTWSALTARGTPELSHHAALTDLQAAAGSRLDPIVVRAARNVIAQERVSVAEPAPEPRLHHLHLPASLRRALAAG
jgi:hypothetical protein